MPDLLRSEVWIGSEKCIGGSVVIPCNHNRENRILAADDRADVGVLVPGGPFVGRVRHVRVTIAADPAEIDCIRDLAGRFAHIILSNTNRRILTAGASGNVPFGPGNPIVSRDSDSIRAYW